MLDQDQLWHTEQAHAWQYRTSEVVTQPANSHSREKFLFPRLYLQDNVDSNTTMAEYRKFGIIISESAHDRDVTQSQQKAIYAP